MIIWPNHKNLEVEVDQDEHILAIEVKEATILQELEEKVVWLKKKKCNWKKLNKSSRKKSNQWWKPKDVRKKSGSAIDKKKWKNKIVKENENKN